MRPIAPQTGEVVASPFVAKGYGTHPYVIPCIPPSSRSGERGPHPGIAYRSGDRLGVHPLDGPPPVIRLPSERTLRSMWTSCQTAIHGKAAFLSLPKRPLPAETTGFEPVRELNTP